MLKVMSVFGTRPEAIKMAPVVQALETCPDIDSRVCVTAQHREMLDQVLRLFDIHPQYDMDLMKQGQTLYSITTGVLQGLEPILEQERPDLLLVHGDTTTTFAAALAAYYKQIPVGHVEAGLRSGDIYAPYPEEINRRLTGSIATLNFAPTALARENLLRENAADASITVTGNTVIDALLQAVNKPCELTGLGLDEVDWSRRVILMTCHRRENWGQPMEEIFGATREVLDSHPDTELVIPVHKNPLVREIAHRRLDGCQRVHFCEPPGLPALLPLHEEKLFGADRQRRPAGGSPGPGQARAGAQGRDRTARGHSGRHRASCRHRLCRSEGVPHRPAGGRGALRLHGPRRQPLRRWQGRRPHRFGHPRRRAPAA